MLMRQSHRVYGCSGALCVLVMLLPPESSEFPDGPSAHPAETIAVRDAALSA